MAVFALASAVAAVYLAQAHGGASALISIGDVPSDGLAGDSGGLQNVESEIVNDLGVNDALEKGYTKRFAGGVAAEKHCGCDCQKAAPEFKVKAATMLAQVGDDMFTGPCSSCPCMRKNDEETEVTSLEDVFEMLNRTEGNISARMEERVPVDIKIRVGPKGTNGAEGPGGYKGPEGGAGPVGETGSKGRDGDRGQTGVIGPRGYKGVDGVEGGVGATGPGGDRGPIGLIGGEGGEGRSGGTGPVGNNGRGGGTGARGVSGNPGARGERGLKGPVNAQPQTPTLTPFHL